MRGGTAAHAAALFVLLLHLGALGKVGAFRAVTLDLYAGDRTCSKVDQRKRVLLDTCHKAAHLGLAGGKDTLAMIVAAAGHPGVNASSWTSAAAVEVRRYVWVSSAISLPPSLLAAPLSRTRNRTALALTPT